MTSSPVPAARSQYLLDLLAQNAGPDVLAGLGAVRGPAKESTFRRAFALVSADALDRALGAWLQDRAVQAADRLVSRRAGRIGVRPGRSHMAKSIPRRESSEW